MDAAEKIRTRWPEGTSHWHLDQVEEKETAIILLLGLDSNTLPMLAFLKDSRVIHLDHYYPVITNIGQSSARGFLARCVLDQPVRRIVKREEIPVTEKSTSVEEQSIKSSKRAGPYALKKGLAFVSVNESKIMGLTLGNSCMIRVGFVKLSVGVFGCVPCLSNGSNEQESCNPRGHISSEEADHAGGVEA